MPERRVALVTGASSGFGQLTAAALARKGLRVFGTSRNPKGQSGEGFEMVSLDVDSDESVRACVAYVMGKAGSVDVLVNNAGYVLSGGLEEASIQEAKAQLETNLWGAVRTIDAVLPGMRQRRSGQIINVGSLAGTFPVPFEGYYAVAKAALAVYSQVLRSELMQFEIKVSIVEPGFFRTNIGNARREAANPIEEYRDAKGRALSRLLRDIERGGDPVQVAETIVGIVESPSPRLRYAVGKERRYLPLRRLLPSSTLESAVARRYGIGSSQRNARSTSKNGSPGAS